MICIYDAHLETEPVLSVIEGEAEGDFDLQLLRPCRDGRPSGGPGVSGRIAVTQLLQAGRPNTCEKWVDSWPSLARFGKLDDLAHVIRRGDVEWVTRFLRRFPALRAACDVQGKPFKLLAQESGNQEIADLFGSTAQAG